MDLKVTYEQNERWQLVTNSWFNGPINTILCSKQVINEIHSRKSVIKHIQKLQSPYVIKQINEQVNTSDPEFSETFRIQTATPVC